MTKTDQRRTRSDEGQSPTADEKVIEDGRAGLARTAALLRRILHVGKPHEDTESDRSATTA